MKHGARAPAGTVFLCLITFLLGWTAKGWLSDATITPSSDDRPAAHPLPRTVLPPPPLPVAFNLEGFQRLTGPISQTETGKVLVAIFAGGHARAAVREYLQRLPSSYYTVILFLYDNSSWVNEDIYSSAITVHATRQMKWWFAKRFLQPSMVAAYRALVLVDDDVEWSFPLMDVVRLMAANNVGIAQPARSATESLRESLSYKLTKEQRGTELRFSDFVECGPLTIIRSSVWPCLWEVVDGCCSSGWGLDMVWCRYASEKCGLGDSACAIIDIFVMKHQDTRATRGESEYDPSQEWELYNEKYADYHSRMRILGSKPSAV